MPKAACLHSLPRVCRAPCNKPPSAPLHPLPNRKYANSLITLLQEAVTSRPPPQGKAERVLVFAETVAAANGVANALEAVGVTALLYHKAISASDRAAALASMVK